MLQIQSSFSPKPYPKNPNFHPNSPPLLLRFRTEHRENLRYLKALKILDPNTKPHKLPSQDSTTQILSMVNYLKSRQGFRDSDFPRLAFLCPQIFSPDLDPVEIEPVFDFLATHVSATVEESRALIVHCPAIMVSDVEFCLKPTLMYLRGLGLEKLNSPTSLNAYLLNTRIEKLTEKIKFLRKLGFSKEESSRFCARFPAIFRYSIDNNLRPKLDYLVCVMNRSVEELKEFPQFFAFSLEKRIMPRHMHLMQRNAKVPLKRMLLWGDEKFYAKWK